MFRRALAILSAALLWSTTALADTALSVDLALRLDPAERRLEGHGTYRLEERGPVSIELAATGPAPTLYLDGRAMPDVAPGRGGLRRWDLPAATGPRRLEISWLLALAPLASGQSHRDTLGAVRAVADPRGSFLPAGSGWYPQVARDGQPLLHTWRAVIDVPDDQHALVPGRLLAEQRSGGRHLATYRMDRPGTGIDLIAGPYQITERELISIDGRRLHLRTLFHPELAEFAEGYLDALAGYFALYENSIGPYPYDDFSIVSSPTPTGFGMPTLTYLGIDVLRLPFIRDTSLGHEVLHNWWGNGVYPDYASGNWSEGLTTFMADYAYASKKSPDKARDMRLGWLRDLSAIPAGKDRPLRAFTSRTHGVSAAVGYGKAAMLFVMLRDLLGPETFDRGIRRFWTGHRFTVANWDELREAFETEAGASLNGFFGQWLDRTGLPDLEIADVTAVPGRVAIEVRQGAPAYQLDVPVRIDTDLGSALRRVRVGTESERVEIDAAGRALRVTLDPEFRLLRRLGRDEAPPILREVNLAGGGRLLALGDRTITSAAATLAGRMLDDPPTAADPAQLPDDGAMLVVGTPARVDAWLARAHLPPRPAEVGERGDVQAWATRLPSGVPLVVVSARDRDALVAATRPLPHLGQASWVVIEDGRTLDRGLWPAQPLSAAAETR